MRGKKFPLGSPQTPNALASCRGVFFCLSTFILSILEVALATLSAAIAALERYVGFDAKRSRTVSRRLLDADILRAGAPGVSPLVDVGSFMTLFCAVAFDPLLREAPAAARRATELTPGGACLGIDLTVDGATAEYWPTSVPRSARQVLDVIAEMALGDLDSQRDVAALRIEFVSSWPEIAIHDGAGTRRFRERGANAAHWGQRGHRTSTTVNGSALVSALRSLFS